MKLNPPNHDAMMRALKGIVATNHEFVTLASRGITTFGDKLVCAKCGYFKSDTLVLKPCRGVVKVELRTEPPSAHGEGQR